MMDRRTFLTAAAVIIGHPVPYVLQDDEWRGVLPAGLFYGRGWERIRVSPVLKVTPFDAAHYWTARGRRLTGEYFGTWLLVFDELIRDSAYPVHTIMADHLHYAWHRHQRRVGAGVGHASNYYKHHEGPFKNFLAPVGWDLILEKQ